jgi:hypothetical protein
MINGVAGDDGDLVESKIIRVSWVLGTCEAMVKMLINDLRHTGRTRLQSIKKRRKISVDALEFWRFGGSTHTAIDEFGNESMSWRVHHVHLR